MSVTEIIKRAERMEGFPADRLLKMQEAFETFKKAALQKKIGQGT